MFWNACIQISRWTSHIFWNACIKISKNFLVNHILFGFNDKKVSCINSDDEEKTPWKRERTASFLVTKVLVPPFLLLLVLLTEVLLFVILLCAMKYCFRCCKVTMENIWNLHLMYSAYFWKLFSENSPP